MSRSAEISRRTGETEVRVLLTLDGTGAGTRRTGVGFFDHMLDLVARHGRLDLEVEARGDLETGSHHTVEDVGIVLGEALDGALADRAGIARYGEARVPMDEARAAAAIDVSGRALAAVDPRLRELAVEGFGGQDAEEFLRGVAGRARLTLHLEVEAGTNEHHMLEAAFKAFARALRAAVALDPTEPGVPSTKGVL
jgi:imidazoleglycerol-phosphate dehydratase